MPDADWFRNKLTIMGGNRETKESFRSYDPEKLFGCFIPDNGPFESVQERLDWRMAHWGTIHEASQVTINPYNVTLIGVNPSGPIDDIEFDIVFTTYQTIPNKFFEYIETMGFDIKTYGYSIVGEYGFVENTILYSGENRGVVRNLQEGLWQFGWGETDTWIEEVIEFMIDNDDVTLSEDIQRDLPHREWDPNPIEVSDNEEDDKVKTIRKSPRNVFLGAFSKLVEAPDTEYICLICHTDKSEEVLDPTKVLMTACGHLFHRFCIKEWVKNASTQPTGHNKCPACRTEIVAFHGPDSALNSQETDAVQTPKE